MESVHIVGSDYIIYTFFPYLCMLIFLCISSFPFSFLIGREEASRMAACFKSRCLAACAESCSFNPRSTLSSEMDRHPQTQSLLDFIHLSGNRFKRFHKIAENCIFLLYVFPSLSACASRRQPACKISAPTEGVFVKFDI